MGRRRVRFTLRRMMVLILGLAMGLHLTVAAWRAYLHGHPHLHSAIYELAGGPGRAVAVRRQPFWPAFWRRSVGWSGAEQNTCFLGGDALLEMCELANPEIRMALGPNNYAANYTKEQNTLFWRLWGANQKPADDPVRRPVDFANDAISWLLDDPLPRSLAPASIKLIVAGFSGIDALVTKAGMDGR